MGVPTIGSRIPGLVDSVEDGKTGVLFPVGHVDALADTMLEFHDEKAKYEDMRARAKERVDQYFTADLLYESLRDIYFELANRYGCRRQKNELSRP